MEIEDTFLGTRNDIKAAICNNDPIEEKLHVIIVSTNACQYARRIQLSKEFQMRCEVEPNIILYVVELAYGDHPFHCTQPSNPRHLQLRTKSPLWHKESMGAVAVRRLLPNNYKAFAWIDDDIEFENPSWAMDTLKILNGCRDVVQLFSHAIDMDMHENAMSIYAGLGYQHTKRLPMQKNSCINQGHPGYAYAITRKAYERIGGLYPYSILGSGDLNMAMSFLGKGLSTLSPEMSPGYRKSLHDFESKAKTLRLGYVPGVVRHHFHGHKKNRQYDTRWKILVKHQYDPYRDVFLNADGILEPTEHCSEELLMDILAYFKKRNEDDRYV